MKSGLRKGPSRKRKEKKVISMLVREARRPESRQSDHQENLALPAKRGGRDEGGPVGLPNGFLSNPCAGSREAGTLKLQFKRGGTLEGEKDTNPNLEVPSHPAL